MRKADPDGIMSRTPVQIALLLLTAAWCLGITVADAGSETGFRRGIGISQVMSWAKVEPGPAHAFAFPPFPDPSTALTADELRTLRHSGFDFVRLAVDPGPFLQFQGTRRDTLDHMLLDQVNLIRAAGFSVIVDFHPSDVHPDYAASALTAGVETPIFQAYLRLLTRTAELLEGLHSRDVALELMNEPPVQQEVWQPMLEAAYAAGRRGAPNLLLVIEGGDLASPDALMAIRTRAFAADPAVLFTFHYYGPYQFTHQGAPWNAARYLADVPYPARARPLQDSLAATAAAIARSNLSRPEKAAAYQDAQLRLERYWRSGFDSATIDDVFDRVARWARTHGVASDRVLLGEFGARQAEASRRRDAERPRWFRDVRAAAQTRGFGWAVWTYRDNGGFGLAGETGGNIDLTIADALGLASLAPAKRALGASKAASDAKP